MLSFSTSRAVSFLWINLAKLAGKKQERSASLDQYQHAVLRYDNLLLFGGDRRVLDGNAVPHAYSDMFSEIADSHHAEVNENHKTGGRRKAPGFMRKQQRFSLHCLPGCGTIAVLRQGSTTMKTTAMTAEEHVRYMTQAPVRRLILEMSAPTVISMLVTSFYNMADGVASVGGGRRAAGIVFDPGRLYPAKSFRACRRGVRPARRGSAGLCAGAAYGAVRAEDVSQ